MSYIPKDRTDLLDKFKHMIEQAKKKNSSERKPSASQVANDELRIQILDFMIAMGVPQTVSDICANVPGLEDASSQKISGLMRPLILHGRVERFVDKRKTYYRMTAGI